MTDTAATIDTVTDIAAQVAAVVERARAPRRPS